LNKENYMKFRNVMIAAALGIVAAISTVALAAITTSTNPANAPTGTHYKSGTASCSVSGTTVNCTGYTLAGVGNADATASLVANYSGTIDCTNKGGNLVESHTTSFTDSATSGSLSPKNGNLTVPSLTASPTQREISGATSCPNPNWTATLRSGSLTLTSFTYTLTFAGFSGPYITITGP
jgi:hypothetical protein